MTLEQIKASDALFLTPSDIAPILSVDPQLIRCQARANPALLGFPVTVMKSRTKIPRKPFLAWLGETDENCVL